MTWGSAVLTLLFRWLELWLGVGVVQVLDGRRPWDRAGRKTLGTLGPAAFLTALDLMGLPAYLPGAGAVLLCALESRRVCALRLLDCAAWSALWGAVSYVLSCTATVSFGLAAGERAARLEALFAPGVFSLLFRGGLLVLCLAVLLFVGRKPRRRAEFAPKQLLFIALISGAVYAASYFFTDAVQSSSLEKMHQSMVVCWCFMAAVLALTLRLLWMTSEERQEREEMEQVRYTTALLEENYRNIRDAYERSRENIHDFRHHLAVLRGCLDQGEPARARAYLENLLALPAASGLPALTGVDVVDAVVNSLWPHIQRERIEFQADVVFPDADALDPVDLCGVTANLLENAVEACARMAPEEKRRVSLTVYQRRRFAFLQVENTVAENPLLQNPSLLSTKGTGEGHGLGLRSVERIAEKYHGTVDFSCEGRCFRVSVMLCCP